MRLKKTVGEVEELPLEEFYGWIAFLQLEAEAHEEARREASRGRR